ncbi:Protein HflC [Pseudomonas syringae pv. aceris]|nr:Protein HflC [Pseudomonas syringae pv. aceris]
MRIIVQAYVAWQVQGDADNVQRFMRAVQNQPDEAARQIRTFVGSALETTASSFDLSSLVNTDASKVNITAFENQLRQQIDQQLLATYGVRVLQVGVERLTLPSVTLNATVDRMRAERETIATERTAVGKREAAQIRRPPSAMHGLSKPMPRSRRPISKHSRGLKPRRSMAVPMRARRSSTTCCARWIRWALS